MTEPVHALDPLALPLQGSRLIEASAGTGKTWTIAALYLRLVLGHGGTAAGPVRALLPGEILVMSFTTAATRELSDRIRQRLVQAAACFRGTAEVPADDGFLGQLLQAHPPGAVREQAAWRLAAAAEAMDDAAVFTIDAWCQRMLREHAFDSGCLFDEELQADEGALRDEAARDYWRQQVYALDDAALSLALATWPDVDALARDVKRLLNHAAAEATPATPLSACMAAASAARAQALAQLKDGWAERAEAMRAWLHAQLAPKVSVFNKRKLQPAKLDSWLDAIVRWAGDPEAVAIAGLTETNRFRLGATGLHDALNEGASVELPPHFAAFEALLAALPGLPSVAAAVRAHARAHVERRLQQLKRQAGRFGFADMLQRLDDALDEARLGERARRLRERIVTQHPVALVDEFQDTSPVQLSIFDRLYRIARTPSAQALLLIGDPKQAIYGFRGADIHSYLQARRATAGRHHVLGTNRRSSVALVAAVNACFRRAEERPGAGAFLFRADAAPGDAGELPFLPVAAHGREEVLVGSGPAGPDPMVAMWLCMDTELRSGGDSRAHLAALCAERIVTLLNDAGAGFARAGTALQRLCPADIAVLVRTGQEAAAVRAALQQRGVATVYLSDKDSVFASDEAADLLRLLQAVAAPHSLRLARAALATALLGLELRELLQLASDDAAFDARCATLAELQRVWQAQGVLPMLRRALHAFGLPARWLAADRGEGGGKGGGERRLTNVLHLAELLQAASATLEGEGALLRWLAQQIDDAEAGRGGQASEEQVLRLESDADLVKVVTVHKSKGLEYPLVFLPFATQCRPVTGARGEPVLLADAQGRRRLCLAPSAADIAVADAERLREDIRLLYVALTRARHHLWVGVAPLTHGQSAACTWHRSAWGSLVSGPAPRTADETLADMQTLAAELPGARLSLAPAGVPTPALPSTRLLPRGGAAALQPALPYAAAFDRHWTLSSYSALVRDAAAAPAAPDATAAADLLLRPLRDDEPALPEGAAGSPRRAGDEPWHRFPRGALAGNFLHDQLEWLAGEGFALAQQPALQQALQRRCERQGWGHRADEVLAWLQRVCSTALPPLGVALSGLDRALPEMEFWLPSDGLDTRALDALCRQHLLPGRARPALVERQLRGLLMGFADLVFEHGRRYGVLDYKSNALGARDADYTTAAMEAAMLEHRYDVQAALYLLALHRLLRTRLGAAYRPAQQLHGAVYHFLRGVGTASAGAYHLPAPLALIDALDALLPAASTEAPGA